MNNTPVKNISRNQEEIAPLLQRNSSLEHGLRQSLSLEDILEREFMGETFTYFAVMTWHHEGDLDDWKRDFRKMIIDGDLVVVEHRPLGMLYKCKNVLVEIKQRRTVPTKRGLSHQGQQSSLAMDQDGYRAWGFGDTTLEADKKAFRNLFNSRRELLSAAVKTLLT